MLDVLLRVAAWFKPPRKGAKNRHKRPTKGLAQSYFLRSVGFRSFKTAQNSANIRLDSLASELSHGLQNFRNTAVAPRMATLLRELSPQSYVP